jgi:hypothetical protein
VGAGAAGGGVGAGSAGGVGAGSSGAFLVTGVIWPRGSLTTRVVCRRGAERAGARPEVLLVRLGVSAPGVEVAVGSAAAAVTGPPASERLGFLAGLAPALGAALAVAGGLATAAWSLAIASASLRSEIGTDGDPR